jgi:CRISPR-associated endonuclease Cas1
MTWRRRGNNARHPVNAMLNYGYGMVINQIRTEIVAAGLDPSIGIVHSNPENPIPLVYDLMEPLRPLVDRKVLEFAFSHTFTPGDFTINKWGGCRLNPQMARVVASQAANVGVRPVVEVLIGSL